MQAFFPPRHLPKYCYSNSKFKWWEWKVVWSWFGAEVRFKIHSALRLAWGLVLYPSVLHKVVPSEETLNLTKTKELF